MTTHQAIESTRHAYPSKLRTLTVSHIEDLSPTMRRFVLTGAELEAEFPIAPMTTTTHVKVVVPQPTGEVILPRLGERGLSAPDGVELSIRDYTVRAFDSESRSLTLDFVLHDDGPAGRWAIGARTGDRLGVMGPRGYRVYPSVGRYVLGADETAFPALERWIEEAPREARIDAYVAGAERRLPHHPGLTLNWIPDIAGALSEATPASDGDTYVWAAAESGIVAPLRRQLTAAGFARTAYDVSGYWRIGRAGSGDGDRTGGRAS